MSITHSPFRSFSLAHSSWILVCGLITLWLTTQASAAHVQVQDRYDKLDAKDVSTKPAFHPDSLRAAFELDDDVSLLFFNISGQYNGTWTCVDLLDHNVTVAATLSTLGSSETYHSHISRDACATQELIWKHTTIIHTKFSVEAEIKRPAPLAAYEVRLELYGSDKKIVGSFDTFVTPKIDSVTIGITHWSTIAIFALVIVCAIWREISTLNQVQIDDSAEQESTSQSSQGPNRAYLTRIADCLSYIQFIFFSGALSLRYPGFLQPMVSSNSWSTLMLSKGPIVRHSIYQGVKDGIYEMNGTFGGTAGLEHMTQIMGAPITVQTWTNVISLALILLACLTLIIQVGLRLNWSRDWFRSTNAWTVEGFGVHGQKATIWIVTQVFLSYFLLPIVAWTTYQLDHVTMRPIYYTIVVMLVVCLVVAGCWWAMAERSPKTMGYLLIDGFEKRQTSVSPRTQDFYTVITFVLIFLRGVAIGGLQVVGAVQLLVLIGCEIIQMALSAWTKPTSSWITRTNLLTCARLSILLLCSGMLPNLADFEARNALGYMVLVMHAVVLLGLFLGPVLHELVQLGCVSCHRRNSDTQSNEAGRPRVYGLRQLSRRPNTMTNLSTNALPHFDRSSTPVGSSAPSRLSSPSPGSSLDISPQSRDGSRTYFRPPRSPGSSADLSIRNRDWSISETPLSQSTLDTSSQSSSGNTSPVLFIPSPAEAGIDYSFREADLYYGRPRRVSFRQAQTAEMKIGSTSPTLVEKASGSLRRLFENKQ